MEIKVTTQENVIKKTFGKTLPITLEFDFLKHRVYLYEFKDYLIANLEMNSSLYVI